MEFSSIFTGLYDGAAKVCSSIRHFFSVDPDRSVSIGIWFNYSQVEHFWLLIKLTSDLETSVHLEVLNKLATDFKRSLDFVTIKEGQAV